VSTWTRYWREFELTSQQSIEIAIRQPLWGRGSQNSPTPWHASVDIGAIMLEANVQRLVQGSQTRKLPSFSNTGQTRTRLLPLCQDTKGDVFRGTRWTRHCMNLCADGYSDKCDSASGQLYCYRESQFNINQRDIETGNIVNQAGFARGNFNYRIESIGLNFVGSGIRNCADSTLPSTCYAAGFVPYSIVHNGPYIVRNYDGQDYAAKLFTGRIEHARGLATERYLTNPISGDDSALIEQYMRAELQGRPLDGNFAIRVWEENGIDFDSIQDVQVVLKYRYWTRFN
jgi:hypothetical protein